MYYYAQLMHNLVEPSPPPGPQAIWCNQRDGCNGPFKVTVAPSTFFTTPLRRCDAPAHPHSHNYHNAYPHPPSSPPMQRRPVPALAAGQCAAHRSHPHGT